MTTTTDIRAAITAKLKAIIAIGQVHDYERFAKAEKDLRELYQSNNRILGWVIRRASFKKTELATALYSIRNSWEVRGYMSLQDDAATELIFDSLVDLVQLKLSNDPTFAGIASYVNDYEMRATLEPVMFCGVLCHSVTINFDTAHEETATIDSALNDFLTLNSQYDIEPFVSAAERAKWKLEPPDYSSSRPELIDTLNVQE